MEDRAAVGDLGKNQGSMKQRGSFFENKKVLITGHTGFKGAWLSKILLSFGARVVGVALKPTSKPNAFDLFLIEKEIHNYFVDIRNFGNLRKIFAKEKPEIVFHLAAQPLVRISYDDPLQTFGTNIMGTAHVLQAVKETDGVRSVVIVTTDKVYKNENRSQPFMESDELGGHDPYSASKAAAELVIDSYIKSFFKADGRGAGRKTLVASARAGNVIGGGDWSKDRLLPDIVRSVFENHKKNIVRNPNAVRPWQHVLDPLAGYLMLAEKLYEGKKEFSGAWNFGPESENYVSVKELLEKAHVTLGKGSYAVKGDPHKFEAQLLKLDITKAKKNLKWRPALRLDTALTLTLEWYESFYGKEDVVGLTDRQIRSFFAGRI